MSDADFAPDTGPALPPPVRHITTHDRQTGKAIFLPLASEPDQHAALGIPAADPHPLMTFYNLHSSGTQPPILAGESDLRHFTANHTPQMPTLHLTNGTVLRVVDFHPGNPPIMHRTSSLDYAVVLSGSAECILDSGDARILETGHILIQRGTMHAWRAVGTEPARVLFSLTYAEPDVVAGEVKGTNMPLEHFPEDRRGGLEVQIAQERAFEAGLYVGETNGVVGGFRET